MTTYYAETCYVGRHVWSWELYAVYAYSRYRVGDGSAWTRNGALRAAQRCRDRQDTERERRDRTNKLIESTREQHNLG